jgi:hypothetical protein
MGKCIDRCVAFEDHIGDVWDLPGYKIGGRDGQGHAAGLAGGEVAGVLFPVDRGPSSIRKHWSEMLLSTSIMFPYEGGAKSRGTEARK